MMLAQLRSGASGTTNARIAFRGNCRRSSYRSAIPKQMPVDLEGD